MRRLLTGIAGALGLAAILRALRRRRTATPPAGEVDPAAELRAKLAEARDAADDRDAFDAAEGVPVDAADAPAADPRSLEERRRAIHDKAEEALGLMRSEADEHPGQQRDD